MKRKIYNILIIIISILITNSSIFAEDINLDSVSELPKYKYSGTMTYSDSNFENRNGVYIYKGSANPARSWVNWEGQYCFISGASKIKTNEYEVEFVENEWCLIQTSEKANKYRLYEFDSNGFLTNETSDGYSLNGSPLEFKANGDVIGSISDSKVKIKTYDDVNWLEYPEGSNNWFCGYNSSGNNFSFLTDGYAIIYEEDEGDFSLYKFNSDSSCSGMGASFTHKSEAYIKSIITSEINSKPAKFSSVALPEDYEIDLNNWEDKTGQDKEKIQETPSPGRPKPANSSSIGAFGETQAIYYGGNKLHTKLNLFDSFECYKGINLGIPIMISPSMNAQLINNSKSGELNNSYNTTTYLTDIFRVGPVIGESPLYLYNPCTIMNDPATGRELTWDEGVYKSLGGYIINMSDEYEDLKSYYLSAVMGEVKEEFSTSLYGYWNSDVYTAMGLDISIQGSSYDDVTATGWSNGEGIKAGNNGGGGGDSDDDSSESVDSSSTFKPYKCPNPNSHKKHEHKDTDKSPMSQSSSGGLGDSSWSKSKSVKVERNYKEYEDGTKQIQSWKVTENTEQEHLNSKGSSSSKSTKIESHSWEAEGQLDCEGEFTIELDKSNMDQVISGGTQLIANDLKFDNDEVIYSIPEQHGQLKINSHIEGTSPETAVDSTSTMQQWTLFGTGNSFGFAYPKNQDLGTASSEINDIGFINVYEDSKIFYPHIRRRYSDTIRPTDWVECYTVAHEYGTLQDNIVVQVAMQPINKPTLHVDAVWSGWANDMNGIVNNGVTEANGDDRDVVVNGGSTMYISTKNTPKNGSYTSKGDVDVAKMGVTVYINSCYGNEHSYSVEDPMSANGYDGGDSSELEFDDEDPLGLIRSGGGFQIGDEVPNFKMINRSKKGKTNGLTEAQEAIINFFNDMKKNLGHYRLEKVMAEGIFTQGQEYLFDQAYKTVSGINAVDTFGSFGQGNKSYNTSRAKQTSTLGNKLNTDDAKYQLTSKYNIDDTTNNSIDISCNYSGLDLYWAKIDIRKTNNKAYLVIGKNNGDGKELDLTELKPLNAVQEVKLFNKLKSIGQDWLEMEIATGWLRDILTSTVHNQGVGTARPNRLTINGKGAINGNPGRDENSAWYQEGTWYFFMTRGQAEYTLSLATEKVETMDPALCGIAESAYDIRNWNKDEDESYMVGGVKIPLKNKIRTFRYQLSPYFSYNDDSDSIPDRNKNTSSQGEKFYLGTIRHPVKDKNGDYVMDDVKLDVYCQGLDFSLKSKLMYLTNATVHHNNR